MHGLTKGLMLAGGLFFVGCLPLSAAPDDDEDRSPPPVSADENPPRRRPETPPEAGDREGRRPTASPRGDGARPSGPPPWSERPRVPGEPGRGPEGGPHPHANDYRGHGRPGEMHPHDPEMAKLYKEDSELDRQTHELGERYRTAKDADRDEAMTRLKAAVVKHFEVRQQRRELELKRLEEQLDRLRSSMKRRGEQQDEIIKQRLEELVGKPDDLGF